jgi:glutathione S-transferase
MRLYRIPYSTNVERVALALAHKSLEIESVWIDPSDRGEVERISGQPLVPVLEVDGRVIPDSMAIVSYLEARWPEPRLYPAERARRAELEIFIDWFNRVWKRPPNEIAAELARSEPDRPRIQELGDQMREWLDLFEALLDGRDYLFGDQVSAADCAAFPFLKYALLHDEDDEELFHRILVDNLPIEGHPRLEAWIRRVDELPRA